MGPKLVYECHTGYKMAGNSERMCQMDGQWSGNVPSCEQIVCPGPVKPEYGYFDGKDFTFDKIITFECQPRVQFGGK